MRWVGLFCVVVAVGCGRENPQFGVEDGSTSAVASSSTTASSTTAPPTTAGPGTTSTDSASASVGPGTTMPPSGETSSGSTDPPYACDEPGFAIEFEDPDDACFLDEGPVRDTRCFRIIESNGDSLLLVEASCASADCLSEPGGPELGLEVEGAGLAAHVALETCVFLSYFGTSDGDGCTWDALAFWTRNSGPLVALGNGPPARPDGAFEGLLTPGGGMLVNIKSERTDSVSCDFQDCDEGGLRTLTFGTGTAQPDGDPVPTTVLEHEMVLHNHGLGYGDDCEPLGRWIAYRKQE